LINNLVHDSRLSAEQKLLLDALKNSTNSLIRDVNNIVEMATPGLINFQESISSFDLNNILRDIGQIVESDKQFSGNIQISISNSPVYQLIGDQNVLKTILIFLLKGTGSYSNEGGKIALNVSVQAMEDNKSLLTFKIDLRSSRAEELKQHFNEITEGKDYAISGIANAFHLISQTENRLVAEFEKHHATFSFDQIFTLDLTSSTESISKPELELQEPLRTKKDLSAAHVLLVEDNEINQKIVLLSLQNSVKKIDVAANGLEALNLFKSNDYDLILMDIMMPVMDGIEATKKIRELESTTNDRIPIIAITANALSGDRDNCLAAGVDDYLSKPFSVEVLINKMTALLG
jgi:CheY-like chemotaxis protein